MSPGDLGQLLKPFVFLDLFDMDKASFPGIGLHPHSGIATVTYLFEGSIRYEDSTERPESCAKAALNGSRQLMAPGMAGDPATAAAPVGSSSGWRCRLSRRTWSSGKHLPAPEAWRATVRRVFWSGPMAGRSSSLNARASLNYLAVRLRAGESWRYQPAIEHTVGWAVAEHGTTSLP